MCIASVRRRPVAKNLPPAAAMAAKASAAALRPEQMQSMQTAASSSAAAAPPVPCGSSSAALPSTPQRNQYQHQQLNQQQQQDRQQQHLLLHPQHNLHRLHNKHEAHVVHAYHDHAADLRDTTKYATRGGVTTPFPLKLHTMLDRIETDGHADVISWQPHGRCFVVHRPKEFVDSVMPEYFKQSKFASFQRQLNLYGFNRLTSGLDRGGYYHEMFLRDRAFLCHKIHRMRVKGTGVRMASSPETEPNFYALPPVGMQMHLLPAPRGGDGGGRHRREGGGGAATPPPTAPSAAAMAYMTKVPEKTLPTPTPTVAATTPLCSRCSPVAVQPIDCRSPPSASASPLPTPALSTNDVVSGSGSGSGSDLSFAARPRAGQTQTQATAQTRSPASSRRGSPAFAPRQRQQPRIAPAAAAAAAAVPGVMTCVYYPPSATTASVQREEEEEEATVTASSFSRSCDFEPPQPSPPPPSSSHPSTSSLHSDDIEDEDTEDGDGDANLDEVEFEGRVFHYLAPFHDGVSEIVDPPPYGTAGGAASPPPPPPPPEYDGREDYYKHDQNNSRKYDDDNNSNHYDHNQDQNVIQLRPPPERILSSWPRIVRPDAPDLIEHASTSSENSVSFFSSCPPAPNASSDTSCTAAAATTAATTAADAAADADARCGTNKKAVVSDDDDDEEEEYGDGDGIRPASSSFSAAKSEKRNRDMDDFIASLNLPFDLNDDSDECMDCLGDDTSFGLMLEKVIE